MTAADPTTELPLRDIHLPEPLTGWWPLAPGWWLVMVLLLVLAGCIWMLLRWQRQRRWRITALIELSLIEADYLQNNNRSLLLQKLSTLIRRVAINRFPCNDCAALTGDDWLRFLDSSSGGDGFLNGPGRSLANGPYQRPTPDNNAEGALLELCRGWLKTLPRRAVR